jgi:hypothetical protein
MSTNNSQSRKWQITINNPLDRNLSHDEIKEHLNCFKSLVYWCMSDEIGEEGTYHTHLFLAFSSAVRFSTLQKHFYGSHFEFANGTSSQNRDYIKKEGKWKNDRKSETSVADTFEEWGELPVERQGQRNSIADLYDMIKAGASNVEILEANPQNIHLLDKVERARQCLREDEYRDKWRDLKVTYVTGKTGSGKSRDIMEKHGYLNVYRVTDYAHPFDGYAGQDVLVFEEYRSQIKISDMLNYLDGYPLSLPCRFFNRIACFTQVYIVTNIALEDQYPIIQHEQKESWNAFLRRINAVIVYEALGKREYKSLDEYLNRNNWVQEIVGL